ncbi:hypothetical protein ACG9WQ_000190 [Acinetobacter variabilis]|uniref:hypothetical protein n=1 Tax=Acinetobacter variabilis TaxID=70346 RepID=UPI003AF4557D
MNISEIILKFENNIEEIKKVKEKSNLPNFIKSSQFEDHLLLLESLCQKLIEALSKYIAYLEPYNAFKSTLKDTSSDISSHMNAILRDTILNFSNQSFQRQINFTQTCIDLVDNYVNSSDYISRSLNAVITDKINEVNEQLENITNLKIKLEGVATEEIYNNAQSKYLERSKNLENYGYLTIFFSVFFTLIGFILHNFNANLSLYLIILKITLIIVAIFLVTYFFKQATHYRKLSDFSEFRHLELEALPSFIATMPETMQHDIKRELTLKYFGQPLNNEHYSSTENIIQDQIKSSTELVKVATNLVKTETLTSKDKVNDDKKTIAKIV